MNLQCWIMWHFSDRRTPKWRPQFDWQDTLMQQVDILCPLVRLAIWTVYLYEHFRHLNWHGMNVITCFLSSFETVSSIYCTWTFFALHHVVDIVFWSSGIIDCMLFFTHVGYASCGILYSQMLYLPFVILWKLHLY